MGVRCLWILAHCLLWALPASAAAGDGIRIDVEGPAVPWARITYEVAARHGSVSARVSKLFTEGFGRREEVGVLPSEELEPLVAAAFEAFPRMPCRRRPRRSRVRYTITLTRAGQPQVCVIDDPDLDEATAEAVLIARVRGVVTANTAEVRFQDALLLPEESGRLRVQAEPTARVSVGGVPVAARTPVEGLRLPVGQHEVRLTPLDGGAARVYPIKIESGKTTALVVDLR